MKGCKILVIDDDPVMVRLIERILRNDGYEVFGALRGKSGLERVQKEIPDLILLDVLMPDIDGKDVARQLQKDPKTKDIPIVFMTVTIKLEDDKGDERIVVDGHNYRAFAKPVHNRKLLSVIRKEINRRVHKNNPKSSD